MIGGRDCRIEPVIMNRNDTGAAAAILGNSFDWRSARRKAATYTQDNTNTEQTHTQTSMHWVEFEPTVPTFERAKTVHSLDRGSTVMGGTTELNI
jgi:hypothetical protein